MILPKPEKINRRPKIQVLVWIVVGTALILLLGVGIGWLVRQSSEETERLTDREVETVLGVDEPSWFHEISEASGIQFTYRNGEEANEFTILEALGGGVALFDFDGDGLLDVFLTGGGYFEGLDHRQLKGHSCKLYKNLGQLKFADVTADVGLEIDWFYNHGSSVADYDRDGWPDLLVTGYGHLKLFHNEANGNGGRRLVDVTQVVGLINHSWSTSAAWGDLDGDGFPELYVCNYVNWSFDNNPPCPGQVPGIQRDVCSPTPFRPQVHCLFKNENGKSFRNVSSDYAFKANGCGLGVILADLNDDGQPDIYVANDTNNNFLYYNRSGRLMERGLLAGVAVDDNGVPNGSMGVDVGDYDGSGRPSLWVTNFQRETHGLYRNVGQDNFVHHSKAAGVAAIGQNFVGFGTGFVDADNDGWEDIVIANGHVFRHVANNNEKQRPVILQNTQREGRRFFQDASLSGGAYFQARAFGRGLAIGDLDNDGWPDLVVSHLNGPVAVLHNEGVAGLAKPNHWLGVKLVGRNHRDVVGSTVIVEGSTRTLTRFANGGG